MTKIAPDLMADFQVVGSTVATPPALFIPAPLVGTGSHRAKVPHRIGLLRDLEPPMQTEVWGPETILGATEVRAEVSQMQTELG